MGFPSRPHSCAALTPAPPCCAGMNLKNGAEDEISYFHGVVIAVILLMLGLFFLIYLVLVRAGMLAI